MYRDAQEKDSSKSDIHVRKKNLQFISVSDFKIQFIFIKSCVTRHKHHTIVITHSRKHGQNLPCCYDFSLMWTFNHTQLTSQKYPYNRLLWQLNLQWLHMSQASHSGLLPCRGAPCNSWSQLVRNFSCLWRPNIELDSQPGSTYVRMKH